jgi:hypothetical protein
MVVQAVQHLRGTAGALGGNGSRYFRQRPVWQRGQQRGSRCLSFALEYDVDGALGVGEDLLGDERHAMAAGEDHAARQDQLDPLGQVYDLRDVGQVIEAEPDGLGTELSQLALKVSSLVDLQVDKPDVMAVGQHRRGHALQPERLKPQEDLGVHQRTGMNQ